MQIQTVQKDRPRLKGVSKMARRLGVTPSHLMRVLWGDNVPSAELVRKLKRIKQPFGAEFVAQQERHVAMRGIDGNSPKAMKGSD